MTGRLVLVGTPIGNLSDLSPRAVETLTGADLIACEDTRHTRGLLTRYEISGKRMLSCHEHNEEARAVELVEAIAAGQNVALVSDAGTPAISARLSCSAASTASAEPCDIHCAVI